MLGIIHDGHNEYEQAQAHYETILRLAPRFAPAANNLAWILVEHGGNLDVALSHAQMAREQQPNDSHIADTLGWIYYKKNANLLATNLLKEAVGKLPHEPAIHFHYGMAQQKNGDRTGAKNLSKRPWNSVKPLTDLKKRGKCWQNYEAEEEPNQTAGPCRHLLRSAYTRHFGTRIFDCH